MRGEVTRIEIERDWFRFIVTTLGIDHRLRPPEPRPPTHQPPQERRKCERNGRRKEAGGPTFAPLGAIMRSPLCAIARCRRGESSSPIRDLPRMRRPTHHAAAADSVRMVAPRVGGSAGASGHPAASAGCHYADAALSGRVVRRLRHATGAADHRGLPAASASRDAPKAAIA